MVRLSIQETDTGWYLHVHPSDKFNLDPEIRVQHQARSASKSKGRPRTVDLGGRRLLTHSADAAGILTTVEKRHMLTKGEELWNRPSSLILMLL